ncbi:coiled-coil domain-containing protein 17 [Elysia marginata]|uniref:Coiled-coil domain-containing protein 17 n=1 Tax=Elysia marginata TaxID=1093978 RepID=A0AAV4EAU3_9GAST|nr:coiled-coil domain-containing protein 17 [Elysia marginata]
MPVDDTVADLRRLKAQRSRERDLRDLEERKLLDELHDANRRLRGSPRAKDKRKRFQLSKDETVREMQIQYERQRERNMAGGGRRDYRRQPELPRYNPSNDPKVRQLAESHGRNMESFHSKNRDLERQREEIRRRLEGLGRRPIKEDDSMNALLQELKDQEARNQRMLEELRRILANQNIPMPQMPQQEPKSSRYVYPIYYGNSLVAEIIAVRQAYIQNGGNDPDILQQLAQMQAEAQAIDDSLRNRPAVKIKGKAQPDNSNLFSLELENERLQRQLLLLQEQNIQARHRRKDDREGRTRVARPRAFSLVGEPLQPWLYQQPRRRAITNYTQLKPLDVNLDPPAPRVRAPEHWSVERTDVTAIDPFKEKIDSDLQNKFGYDLGGSRLSFVKHEMPEDVRATSRDRSHEGVRTLVPDHNKSHEGVDTLVPDGAENNEKHGNGLPPLDLKPLTESEPDASSKKNKNKSKGKPDKQKQKQKAQDLGGRGPVTNPTAANTSSPTGTNANYKKSTQFEDEYFANTSRTEPGDINSHQTRNARYVLDPTTLSSYKPLDVMYGGNPRIGRIQRTNAPSEFENSSNANANASRPQPIPRPIVLAAGAAR